MDLEIPTSLDEITCQLSQAAFCALRAAKYLSKYLAGSLDQFDILLYIGYVDITQGLHSGSFIFYASSNVETNLQMH